MQEGQAGKGREYGDSPYSEFVQSQRAVDLMEGPAPKEMVVLGFRGLSPTYWKELQLPPTTIEITVADEWEELAFECSNFRLPNPTLSPRINL